MSPDYWHPWVGIGGILTLFGHLFVQMNAADDNEPWQRRVRFAFLTTLAGTLWPLAVTLGVGVGLVWVLVKLGSYFSWEIENLVTATHGEREEVNAAPAKQPDLGPHRTPPERCESCGSVKP